MIVRTEAVVLRAMDYGETSRIVTLYTRRHGQIGAMARGARRPKSRFGATLQPMALVEVVYYHKPERDLQTLKEAAYVRRFPRLTGEIDRLALGFHFIELVRALTEPYDPNGALFALLAETLTRLDLAPERVRNVLPHAELRLAELLGFAAAIDREAVLALPEQGGVLVPESGAVLPSGRGVPASRAALRAFSILARTDADTALRLDLSDAEYDEALRLVDTFLRHHAGGPLPERAASVGRQLMASLTPT